MLITLPVSVPISAQVHPLHGVLVDQVSRHPLPYASVYGLKKQIGTLSDANGRFILQISSRRDSLRISSLGYNTQTFPVTLGDSLQTFELHPEAEQMQEVLIHPVGWDPVRYLIRQIILHKKRNDPDELKAYQNETDTKLGIFLTSLPEKMQNSRLLKPFAFILDQADSTTRQGKSLPIFFSQTWEKNYVQPSPYLAKTFLMASRTSGIKNESLVKTLEGWYSEINFYPNYSNFFGVSMISPLAQDGWSYYHYRIEDTLMENHHLFFQVAFHARRSGENTFSGEFQVEDSSFALTRIQLEADPSANLNWIDHLRIAQEFSLHQDSVWLPSTNFISASFKAFGKKSMGFLVKKTILFHHYQIYPEKMDSIWRTKKFGREKNLTDLTGKTNTSIFQKDSLSAEEKKVFWLVDTLKKMPAFKTLGRMATLLATGYYPLGKIEIGSIYRIFTQNPVEGSRLSIGLRTTDRWNQRIQLEGHLGKARFQQQIWYSLDFLWIIHRQSWSSIRLSVGDEVMGTVRHFGELNENSLFSTLLRVKKGSNRWLVRSEHYSLQYQKYIEPDLTLTLEGRREFLSPSFSVFYTHHQVKPILVPIARFSPFGYATTATILRLKYAPHQKYLDQAFRRIPLRSPNPVWELSWTHAFNIHSGWLGSDFQFNKVNAGVAQYLPLPPFGRIYYSLQGGFCDQPLPILLLDVPRGNDTYYFDRYAFNEMNRLEFVSDHFLSFTLEHHWGAFPFHYLPLVKKLKWRTVATFKAFIGGLSQANKKANGWNIPALPFHFTVPDKIPYMEAGIGIENILKILRVEGIWRLTYRHHPRAQQFGIKVGLELSF
ncbi:MAG: DUF5686 and carboxypeptidase-like regulatory domain-containing protein [Chitinophagaceae bacterium]